MKYASGQSSQIGSFTQQEGTFSPVPPVVECDWKALCEQLMLQWPQLSQADLDKVGPNRHRLALLIEHKYRISSQVIENYLRNFERTLPMTG